MTPMAGATPPPPAVETGLVCAGCGALAPAGHPFTPRCPARRPGDDIDHVMARGIDLARLDPPADPDPNPFVRYRAFFHAYHVARAAGWGDARYVDLVRELDDAVAAVDGTGFRITPLVRAPGLAAAAGLDAAGTAWVKDETAQRRRARTRPATCSGSCWSCGSRSSSPARTRRAPWRSRAAATRRSRPRSWRARPDASFACSCQTARTLP